jgi:hypothetical protein
MSVDKDTLQILDVIGTWLSGVGTLLAVVVALYLARSEKAVRLKITAGVRLIITPGEDQSSEVAEISVANTGARTVFITNVLWRWGVVRRRYAVQVIGSAMDSLKLHQRLDVAHRGSFYIELDPDDRENWARRFAMKLPRRLRGLWLRRLEVGIATAVGTTIWASVENTLRDKLLEAAKEVEGRLN